MAWPKAKVTIQKPTGDAAGKTPSPKSSVPEEELLAPGSPSSFVIPVTEDMEADVSELPITSPSFTTPVEPIISPSPDFTDWTVSPISFVEQGLARNTVDLQGLPQKVREALEKISKGTGDPVGSVIQQISEFFMEEESELSEGRLIDALEFYVTNQML